MVYSRGTHSGGIKSIVRNGRVFFARSVASGYAQRVKRNLKALSKKLARQKTKGRFKKKVKQGYSRTMTVVKKEKLSGDDLHSGTGLSRLTVWVKPVIKGVAKRQAHLKFTWDVNGIQSGGCGAQSVSEPLALGTVSQWQTNSGVAYNGQQSYRRWSDMNPNRNITGSGIISSGQPHVDRLALKWVFVDSMFTNLTDIEQDVVIYWIVAKQNTADNPLTSWTNSLGAEGLGNPIITQVGPGVAASGAIGYSNANFSHSRPRGSMFRTMWNVKRARAFKLAAAATYQLKTMVHMNQLYKQEYFDSIGTDGVVYPRGSVVMLMTVNGQLVHDKTDGANIMTFGATCIGYLHKCYNHFGVYQHNAERINLELDVTTASVGASAANQSFMNVVDNVDSFKSG